MNVDPKGARGDKELGWKPRAPDGDLSLRTSEIEDHLFNAPEAAETEELFVAPAQKRESVFKLFCERVFLIADHDIEAGGNLMRKAVEGVMVGWSGVDTAIDVDPINIL